ncbi:MAG: hypothetical protein OEU44_02765, partial [Gammaproteobacteria bacterium]|nr:hypothetical protein [Gammaproteobacteria bacterium]
MKAILHIGTEKTGTTSIQSCLAANRNCLSDMGYAYPFSPGRMNHRKLAVYAMSHDRTDDFCRRNGLLGHEQRISWQEAFRNEFILEISQLDHSIHTVILSSEHLQSRLNSSEDVARLHELLASLFSDIKVLVYLRRQDKAATSRYSTALKAGYSMKSILPPSGGNRRFYDYEHLLDIWSTVFGRKHVVPRIFDRREFVDDDLI